MPQKLSSPQRKWEPARSEGKQTGRTVSTKFYQSPAWRKLRALKISMNPFCEKCEAKGIVTQAKEIDHIKPIRQGGEPLAMNNLMSMCTPCHAAKSATEKAKEIK